jgi:hypothetical protein
VTLLLALVGWALIVGALIAAIVARRTVWGMRLRPPVANPTPPSGPIVLASRLLRGANLEVVPILADWHARGVLAVHRVGPDLPAEPNRASAGPRWRFVVGDVRGLDAVETQLLSAFVPDARPGAESTLEREDIAQREQIAAAVRTALEAQRASFGARPRSGAGVAFALIAAALVGAALAMYGAFAGNDTSAQAWAIVGAVVGVGVVIALCARAEQPTEAERAYRQQLLDLGEWVKTTESPNPALAGWAMLWNLPGEWAAVVPDEIAALRGRDRAFLRADFARRIPTPI